MTKINIYTHPEYYNPNHIFEGYFMVGGELLLLREEWKQIPERKEGYLCSSFGRIKSPDQWCNNTKKSKIFKKGRILAPVINRGGYYNVAATSKMSGGIHAIVAKTWVGAKPFTKAEANHEDGIKWNNHYTNIKWTSSKENTQHAIKTGLIKVGIASKISKPVIRCGKDGLPIEFYECGKATKKHGFCPKKVSSCCNGVRIRHGGYKWRFSTKEEIENYKKNLI